MTLSKTSLKPPEKTEDSKPLVSIILPTYNDFEYIDTAIESVFEQTFSDYELIVIDSSGVSQLESFCDSTPRLRYIHQKPQGPSAARNQGIERANGELIAFIDADDRWREDKIERQVAYLRNGADVVYSDAYIVENGHERYFTSLPVRKPKQHHIDFLYEGGVPMLTVAAHRRCFDRWKFDESLPLAEDRNLLVKLFRDFRPARIDDPLAYYNRRANSASSDIDRMHHSELESLANLCNQFPELASHRQSLVANAHYKYGKKLLRNQRRIEARKQLMKALKLGSRDSRTFILFTVSLLPTGHPKAIEYLERLQERWT